MLSSLETSVQREVPKHLVGSDATGAGEVEMHHGTLGSSRKLVTFTCADWDGGWVLPGEQLCL